MYPVEIPDLARGLRRNAEEAGGHVALYVLEGESLEQAMERVADEERNP